MKKLRFAAILLAFAAMLTHVDSAKAAPGSCDFSECMFFCVEFEIDCYFFICYEIWECCPIERQACYAECAQTYAECEQFCHTHCEPLAY